MSNNNADYFFQSKLKNLLDPRNCTKATSTLIDQQDFDELEKTLTLVEDEVDNHAIEDFNRIRRAEFDELEEDEIDQPVCEFDVTCLAEDEQVIDRKRRTNVSLLITCLFSCDPSNVMLCGMCDHVRDNSL